MVGAVNEQTIRDYIEIRNGMKKMITGLRSLPGNVGIFSRVRRLRVAVEPTGVQPVAV